MVDLLTLDEVAKRLRVKKSTVYKLSMAGKIPKVKIGNIVRVPADKLDVFITEHFTPAGGSA